MCVIFLAYKCLDDTPLLVLGNRDEYLDRPTDALHTWSNEDLVGGRDRLKGGAWMAIHRKTGRFAAVTNIRQLQQNTTVTPGGNSRGKLVVDFCTSDSPIERYHETLEESKKLYDGYSIIYGTIQDGFYYFSNHPGFEMQKLNPGVLYGLSNGNLDVWPKVQRGKELLTPKLQTGVSDEDLFEILKDDWRPMETDILPDTGLSVTTEQFLAPIFIPSYFHNYGTVASTILRVEQDGGARMVERTFRHDEESEYTYVTEQTFRL